MTRIPRSLAFDMLFGSNRGDGHATIDAIYDSIDDEYKSRQIKGYRMNVNDLTLREIKGISQLIGTNNTSCTEPLTKVGDKVFIRTLTYHYIGEVVEETPEAIRLNKTVWVADSGQFTEAIRDGKLSEIEIVGDDTCIVKNNMVDVIPWNHDIPTQRK